MSRIILEPPLKVEDSTIFQLEITMYENGRRAIQAYSLNTESGFLEPFDKLSVNLPNEKIEDSRHFFGMPYDYHKGLFDAALAAGIIEIVKSNAARAGSWGFIPLCKLRGEYAGS